MSGITTKGKKFVLFGTGALARYIRPCLKILAGNRIGESIGLHRNKMSSKDYVEIFDFCISSDDAYAVLLERKPEVIIIAIPPASVKELVTNVIYKYFQYLDDQHIERPIIITFAPSPENSFYTDILGNCKCANVLPNMIRNINGMDCSSIGQNYVTLSHKDYWSNSDLEMISDFMKPCGHLLYTEQRDVYALLAGKCVGNLLLNIMEKTETGIKYSAMIMRKTLHEIYDENVKLDEPELTDIKIKENEIISDIFCSWYDGIISSLKSLGLREELAVKGTSFKLELYLNSIEKESIDKIHSDNDSHRTKGGVQEFADLTFKNHTETLIDESIKKKNTEELKTLLFNEAKYITSATADFCSHMSENSR